MFSRFATLGLRRGMFAGFKPQMAAQRQNMYNQFKENFRYKSFRFQSTQSAKKPTGIKALMQEYGYSALGVYLLLSAIDFPLCFLLVHSYGVDNVKLYQTKVMNWIKEKTGLGTPKQLPTPGEMSQETKPEEERTLWDGAIITEAIVAYALHKSLIFIRVPITAAILPSFVAQLRRWGFHIGNQKMTTIAQHAKDKATNAVVNKAQAVASNPKFGRPANKKNKWTSWFF